MKRFTLIPLMVISCLTPAIGSEAGAIFLLITGLCDMLDGAIARVTKKSSSRGAFIDSTFDRVTEIIIFCGLLIGQYAEPLLVFFAITLSMLVSYARTRAEAINVDLRGVGIAERSERILILCLCSFINEIRLAIKKRVLLINIESVSYTHLTLPTNREV